MNRVLTSVLCATLMSLTPRAHSDEIPKEDGPLPRFEPLEPAEALATFRTIDGFSMELIAAEPMVLDPVAGAFDADGRLYVAEMADYPHVDQANDQPFQDNTGDPPIGRVRLLVDSDGDGVFDESHPFAGGLSWPTGIAPWGGGVFVAATPDLWYLEDTDGDGRADVRERIYTGFRKYNIQAVMNNLIWGLDHRIYGAGSSNGGQVRRADLHGAEAIPLLRSDFRFDPRTLAFEAIPGGARFGNTFDDRGNRFLCNIRNPAQHVVLPEPPIARNPWIPLPSALHDAAEAGDTIVMHRISPPEPWRELRARRWVDVGKELPRSELVGAGYLTSSSGITSYRGDAYPEGFRGNLFLGEVANNLIHRMGVRADGVTFAASRADEGVEFVASTDIWFRPVNFVNAPDGTLVVLDMYRETIEHPWSIPDDIRDRLDLRGGDDRGRIYRLAPPGFAPRPAPRLSMASTAELVALLEHPNGWHRETAHRLIFERQDADAVGPLRRLLSGSRVPLTRLHALWSLEGLGALGEAELARLLSGRQEAGDPVVAGAIRIASGRLEDAPDLGDLVLEQAERADDPVVRFQAAQALGAIAGPRASGILARLAREHRDESWMKAAVLGSAGRDPIGVFRALVEGVRPDEVPDLLDVLGTLAFAVGSGASDEDAAEALEALASNPIVERDGPAAELAMRLGDGLIRRGSGLFEVDASDKAAGLLDDLLDEARRAAADPDAEPTVRARAVALFAHRPYAEAEAALPPLLGSDQPAEVRRAAVGTLARFGDEDGVASLLLDGWETYTPAVREVVVGMLVARPAWAVALLDAIEAGDVSAGQVPPASRSALLRGRAEGVGERAARIFDAPGGGPAPEVLARYRATLDDPGDPARGRAVFDRACATCHRLGEAGHAVGPNLVSVARRTPDELLTHILDPNREVAPDAIEYVVALRDGRVASGLIESESAASLTLLRAGGERETILRAELEELASSGRSLMPEGLEREIAPAEMADLIAFLVRLQSL